MNRINTYLNSLGRATRAVILALAVIFVSAGIAQATTTTINTSVSTTNLTASGTLGVTGLSTLTGGFISVASSTAVAAFNVTGNTTLASTTATSFKAGQLGTQMTRIQSGYCVTPGTDAIAVSTGVGSSTPTFMECSPLPSGVLVTGARVFVQATSSLPSYIIVQSASSTSAGMISLEFINTSTSTVVAAANVYALNFWAFQ